MREDIQRNMQAGTATGTKDPRTVQYNNQVRVTVKQATGTDSGTETQLGRILLLLIFVPFAPRAFYS